MYSMNKTNSAKLQIDNQKCNTGSDSDPDRDLTGAASSQGGVTFYPIGTYLQSVLVMFRRDRQSIFVHKGLPYADGLQSG